MDMVLQQLGQIPGVVGTAVYSRAGQVAASRFPPLFDPAIVQHVASTLAQDSYLEEWLQGPAACLDLRFSEGRVVLRPLPGAWLLVLCTPQVNAQLLALSLTQALRRLQVAPPRPSAPPAPALPPPDPLESVRERLQALAQAELGQLAPQAVELLSRARSLEALAGAAAEVEKMTRLFISRKKAEELAARMSALLNGEGRR